MESGLNKTPLQRTKIPLRQKQHNLSEPCPCGSAQNYSTCCGLYHSGGIAPTAAALMRSRYSAYVLLLEPYLLATWHPSTRPQSLDLSDELQQKTRWLGLEIKRHESSAIDSDIVEFVARYKVSGRAQRMHEISHFLLEDGRWYYLDGELCILTAKDKRS